MYIEHVAVETASGKVTKCTYDAATRSLLYEAEIYDQAIADKIRNGLIQHVSVGADYDSLDVVDAKVPHGLFNPELSLVAVPGIPETNVHVIERVEEKQLQEKLAQRECKLTEAQTTIEDLRKQLPSASLLKNPPKMMPVSEHVSEVKGLLSPLMVERSSMFAMRKQQEIRAVLFRAKEKYGVD